MELGSVSGNCLSLQAAAEELGLALLMLPVEAEKAGGASTAHTHTLQGVREASASTQCRGTPGIRFPPETPAAEEESQAKRATGRS